MGGGDMLANRRVLEAKMRISHAFKFVFLSKYKCASTSIRRALDPFSDIASSQSPPYYHHATLADIEGHFRATGVELDEYFVFTTVRHPQTMLRSLYAYGAPDRSGLYWWERHWDRVGREEAIPRSERVSDDPASFRDWVLEHDLSRFTLDPFIRDSSGSVRADRVLRTEALPAEFLDVTERLGLGRLEVPHINIGPDQSDLFDDAMLDRVREVFKTDIAVGGYTV